MAVPLWNTGVGKDSATEELTGEVDSVIGVAAHGCDTPMSTAAEARTARIVGEKRNGMT